MIAALALLAVGVAAGGWWHFHRPAVDPPLPSGIEDPEVLRAVERARQKVLDKPSSADAWGDLGMTLLANLFDRDADRCFAEAARLAPLSPKWPYGRGIIALRNREYNRALPFLRQALAVAGDAWPDYRTAVRSRLAETLLEQREFDEAEKVFRAEWGPRPGDPRVALGLGTIAVARGDERSAKDFLKMARESPCARKTATVQLALIARSRDDPAADDYDRETAAMADDNPWPDPFLDQVLPLQVGRRRREREVFRLEQQHYYQEAAELYLQELERQPTTWAYIGAGLNLARLRNYERALPLLREAVRHDPESAQAEYTLALALFSRAEREKLLSPDSGDVKEGFEEAVRHARRATELKPAHAEAYLFWGLALKHLGKLADAESPLRNGVACRPSSMELQLALGEVLLESGKCEEARTHLENARKLAPNDMRPRAALERLCKE
jgi:tetratricopeptide (TPR) repeat protein